MAQDERTELELLRDIERWTRLAALPGLRSRAAELLDTDSKRRAYAAMDGATPVRAIETATGANHNDIAQWLKVWVSDGIVLPDTSRPTAAFKLSELGVETPAPKAVRAKKTTP